MFILLYETGNQKWRENSFMKLQKSRAVTRAEEEKHVLHKLERKKRAEALERSQNLQSWSRINKSRYLRGEKAESFLRRWLMTQMMTDYRTPPLGHANVTLYWSSWGNWLFVHAPTGTTEVTGSWSCCRSRNKLRERVQQHLPLIPNDFSI